jgi:hypothetical protein
MKTKASEQLRIYMEKWAERRPGDLTPQKTGNSLSSTQRGWFDLLIKAKT